jgi:hypothetical protein
MPTCFLTCTSVAKDVDHTVDTYIAEPLVDAVDAAQEGRLAATGRADEGGDNALPDIEVDVVQCLKGSIPEVQVLCMDGEIHRLFNDRLSACIHYLSICFLLTLQLCPQRHEGSSK